MNWFLNGRDTIEFSTPDHRLRAAGVDRLPAEHVLQPAVIFSRRTGTNNSSDHVALEQLICAPGSGQKCIQ